MSNPTITVAALDVLARSVVEGANVRLPAGQLARPLYVEVNEVLSRLGGKWKGGKAAAHQFGEIDPAPLLAEIVATGQMPAKNPTAFFWTPPDLARRMVALAGGSELNEDHVHILEPSAGLGAIAFSIRDVAPDAQLDLVEVLPAHVASLRRQGYNEGNCIVYACDFLTIGSGLRYEQYDAIVMNPPFAVDGDQLAYIAHIRRAHSLLAKEGTLVAIAPAGVLFRDDKRTRDFRRDVESVGTIEPLPPDSFAESGTNVNTVLLTMRGVA